MWICAFCATVAVGRFRLNSMGIAEEGVWELQRKAGKRPCRRMQGAHGSRMATGKAKHGPRTTMEKATVDGSSFTLSRGGGTSELSGTRVPGKRMVCHAGSSMAGGVAIKTPMAFNVIPKIRAS